jgi:guanosine-3',5'-bis(diphosphate) 3'-pyrophosphohydrolase
VTGRARAAIRKFIRSRQVQEYVYLGRAILTKSFEEVGYTYSDKAIKGVLKIFRHEHIDDLIAAVGSSAITAREVLTAVFPGLKEELEGPSLGDKVVPLAAVRKDRDKDTPSAVPIKGLTPGMALHYANCCHPLMGDRIVGILTPGKGVTIHTIDCDTLESFSELPERWLDVAWERDHSEERVGRINVTVINEPGTLSALASVIAKNFGNILNLKITNREIDFFDISIDVEVKNVKHLSNIIAALRATPAINSVERARG